METPRQTQGAGASDHPPAEAPRQEPKRLAGYPEADSAGEANPFSVHLSDLTDGALYERLCDFARVLVLLTPYASSTGTISIDLLGATRALHREALRRGIPVHHLPRLPWEESDA